MTKPVRLQLSRKRGFNLQRLSRETNGLEAVNVARPSKWGNPWRIADAYDDGLVSMPAIDAATAVQAFREYWHRMLDDPGTAYASVIASLADLRGKNLACWCAPDAPCHASVLLEISNR